MSAEGRDDGSDDAGASGGGGGGSAHAPRTRTRKRAGTDEARAIVIGMQRGETAAFTAFVERYQRLLLHYARRAGLRGDAADEVVTTVLGDAAVALVAPAARVPDDVALYLIGAFRHRLLNERRGDARRERRVSEASADGGDARVALCSESSLRASYGPGWEPPPPSEGLGALSRMLSASLTDDERRMLAWDSEDVPQREIAERLGVTHAAVRQRLRRLRARLRVASEQYAAGLEGDGGRVVRRFLRRSLATPHRSTAAASAAAASPGEGARQRRANAAPLAGGAGQGTRVGGPADE